MTREPLLTQGSSRAINSWSLCALLSNELEGRVYSSEYSWDFHPEGFNAEDNNP